MKTSGIVSPGILRLAGLAAVAALMAGCANTYGTGTSPGVQTVEDIAGIVAFGSKKEPIDYSPRPPIVAPPSTASLPPPGSSQAYAAQNWPQDPDVLKKKLREREEEARKYGGTYEGPASFSAPTGSVSKTASKAPPTKEEMKKMFAEARGSRAGSVDAEGNPTRKYLTEPPASYREPDPNSPVDVNEKPKKKKKSWWPF